jgi:hypothetical protein
MSLSMRFFSDFSFMQFFESAYEPLDAISLWLRGAYSSLKIACHFQECP